jgi:glycoside/pentoside/hexuronide:cation symporter, GPH family
VAVMVAQFIIQVLLLPFVLILGHGDKARGFHNTMTLFAIVGTVFFLITFFTTRERVVPAREQTSSVRDDLVDLARNRPWQIMLAVTVLLFINLALKGGMYIYYFKYYLHEEQLASFLQSVGFNGFIAALNHGLGHLGLSFQWPQDAPTSAFSLFNALGIIFMIVGIGFSKPLADRYGKRDVFGGALFASTLFLLAFYVYSPDSIALVVASYIFHGFFYGITIPLLWAMTADVADYSEWKNRRRATAMIFSAMLCGLKVGLSIGGALVAGILAWYGYHADAAAQSAGAINGIRLAVSLLCSLPFLAAVGLMFLYEIDKPMELRIEQELDTRRLQPSMA